MARKPRIEFPGAFYHVMTRGNRKADIFRDDTDREKLLQKLLAYKKRYGFILYAYTLMPNHIHLLAETKETPLSKIMQGLLQSHTQWFNRKYKTVGHLFQGRYKAILCDKAPYLLALVRYLHINCVRSGITTDPMKYRWSSHRIYLDIEKSELIDTELVLSQFSKKRSTAIRAFESFVREGIGDKKSEDLYRVIDQRFLGNEYFVDKTKKKMDEPSLRKENIRRNKTLDEVGKAVKKLTNFGIADLRSRNRSRETAEARNLFVHLALNYSGSKRKDIAKHLRRSPKMVSYLERKLGDKKMQIFERKLGW